MFDRLAGLSARIRQFGSLSLRLALRSIVARLTRVAGRDDDLWVFGARGGETFGENSKYCFLHVAAERPEIRPVWLARDDEVIETVRDRGYEAYRVDSLRGRWVQARAGVVFLTHNFEDLDVRWTGGALTVMLWHGVPLKYISWDAELRALPWPVDAAVQSLFDCYDLVLATSESTLAPMVSAFHLPYDRYAPVGYPRTDALLGSVPDADAGRDDAALDTVRDLDGDVVLYVPTFRDDPDDRAAARLDESALARLDALCARRDAHFVMKPHPKETLSVDLAAHDRLHRLPGDCDLYSFLPLADVLVTDYSSVYLEYLLLDRPVVFYPYDLERYRDRRGLYYDYDAVTPGPRADDFAALLSALDRTLARETDDAAARAKLRDRFFDARSPNRSAAVVDLVRRRQRRG